MPTVMIMPKLGVNMTEATVVEWVVKPGDAVKEGQTVLNAETDKAVVEIPSTVNGILAEILVQAGETVPCQESVAVFIEPGEKYEGKAALKPRQAAAAAPSAPDRVEIAPSERKVPVSGRARISPLARSTARKLNLDISQIRPSRPDARIVKADILAFAASGKATTHGATESAGLTGVRKRIADKMSVSSRTTARAVLSLRADAGPLIAWREELKREGHTVSFTILLASLVARALRENPALNSSLTDRGIVLHNDVNIGIAVDTDRGLLVPVIPGADRKAVLEMNAEFARILDRARAGKSTPDDLAGGTFTISNLGMFEIESFTPIINYPECAILGVGAIVREPVVSSTGGIKAGSRMELTLAFDHRIVDGAPAARFLQRVKQLVERPEGA